MGSISLGEEPNLYIGNIVKHDKRINPDLFNLITNSVEYSYFYFILYVIIRDYYKDSNKLHIEVYCKPLCDLIILKHKNISFKLLVTPNPEWSVQI